MIQEVEHLRTQVQSGAFFDNKRLVKILIHVLNAVNAQAETCNCASEPDVFGTLKTQLARLRIQQVTAANAEVISEGTEY